MAPRKHLQWAAAFIALGTPTQAQDCAESSYSWCPDQPFYYQSDTLPLVDGSTCCGMEILGDPSVGDSGFTCLCDLTAGVCDVGCCCDLDCSYDSLRTGGVFGCTTNGSVVETSSFTVCSENLISTNIPQYAQDEGLARSFGGANGLLCVFSDNSPARGAFFRDPTATERLTAQIVTAELANAKPLQYGTSWMATMEQSIPPPTYSLGAPLLGDGCLAASDPAGCSRRAPVLLPKTDLAGGCSGQQQLGYLRDVKPFTCSLLAPSAASTLDALRTLCETTLNASALNAATIMATPAQSAQARTLSFLLSHRVNGTDSSFESVTSAPSSFFDAADGTCHNALVGYQLRVVPSGEGSVTSASAYLTVQTLPLSELPSTTARYAAAFEYAATPGVSVRPTSGRPGYMRGLPLLVGEEDTLRSGGLQMLPRTATGQCASSPTHSGGTPVRFGEELAVSCTLTLSPADLEAFCLSATPLEQQTPFLALNLTQGVSRIGMFGDSHPSNSIDWVPLTVRSPTSTQGQLETSWDASTSECANVLTGLHLRILYSDVGRVAVPVSKVVGAELLLSSRTIPAARGVLGTPRDTTITVTATTTFARLDGESFEFVPESPQIIPPLPYDFFYPFTTSY